jgi:hypothetical protein
MSRLPLLLTVGALAMMAALPSTADAAYFTGQPFTYQQAGAGPFQWTYRSSDPDGPQGTVAYKLSTEANWHRCSRDGPAPALTNLAEGKYTIDIADDIGLDWYAARGLFYSGFTQPCFDSPPAAPNAAVTEGVLYVDSTPPTVTAPNVIVADKTVQVSSTITESLSGVQSVIWSTGDGASYQGANFFRHTYLNYGDYTGQVTVLDLANNKTTRQFAISVPKAAVAAPAAPPRAPASAVLDRKPPMLLVTSSTRQPFVRRHGVAMRLSCNEPCAVVATGHISIGAKHYRLSSAKATLAAKVTRTLRLTASKSVTTSVANALKNHKTVRAVVTLASRDVAGNRRSNDYIISGTR